MEGIAFWVRTRPLEFSVLLLSLFLISLQGSFPTQGVSCLPGSSPGWLTLDGSLSLNLPFALLCDFIHNRPHLYMVLLQEVLRESLPFNRSWHRESSVSRSCH